MYNPSSLCSLKDTEHAERNKFNDDRHGQVGMLFLADAVLSRLFFKVEDICDISSTHVQLTSLLTWTILFTCSEESKPTVYDVDVLVFDSLQLVYKNCLHSPAITYTQSSFFLCHCTLLKPCNFLLHDILIMHLLSYQVIMA